MPDIAEARAKRPSSQDTDITLIRNAQQQQAQLLAEIHAMMVRMETRMESQLLELREKLEALSAR